MQEVCAPLRTLPRTTATSSKGHDTGASCHLEAPRPPPGASTQHASTNQGGHHQSRGAAARHTTTPTAAKTHPPATTHSTRVTQTGSKTPLTGPQTRRNQQTTSVYQRACFNALKRPQRANSSQIHTKPPKNPQESPKRCDEKTPAGSTRESPHGGPCFAREGIFMFGVSPRRGEISDLASCKV